jgi:hypothetical protein
MVAARETGCTLNGSDIEAFLDDTQKIILATRIGA